MTICSDCAEGLPDSLHVKTERIQLLSQVRRGTRDDQEAVLNWLLEKFRLRAVPKDHA